MPSTDFNAELDLPSVIIDVPELQQMIAKKKRMHTASLAGAAVLFVVLAGLIFMELTAAPKKVVAVDVVETDPATSIRLTVKLIPENISGTVVEVDGKIISGNPPYVYLTASEEYHSVKVNAPGYEGISKDVQLTSSEVMTFTLTSLSGTSSGATGEMASVDGDDFDTDSFGENSDDLIEEVDESQMVAAVLRNPKKGKGRTKASAGNTGRRVGNEKRHSTAGEKKMSPSAMDGDSGTAVPAAPVAPTSSSVENNATANTTGNSAVVANREAAPAASQQSVKASLIINAPEGVGSRVAVFVDGQMRGYLPVLLKIDAGPHELTFVYDGHRSFQRVTLSPGGIARIVPTL